MEISGGTHVNEQKPCVSEIQCPSSASADALPELPQTLNTFDGQQQFINSAARDVIRTYPYPLERLATNTASFHIPMPGAQSSQFQGSHVTPLRNCLGRTTDLMERWNHIYGNSTTQTPLTSMPPPLHHQYAMQVRRPFLLNCYVLFFICLKIMFSSVCRTRGFPAGACPLYRTDRSHLPLHVPKL